MGMESKAVYMVLSLALFFLSLGFSHSSETSDMGVDRPSNTFAFREPPLAEGELSSLPGISRFLTQYDPRAAMTCNNFPRMCRAKGSPGPDCCKKRCVNVMTDGLNCGQCGRRCRYGEACCGGRCMNIMYDRKNCGGCHKRCKKGSYCRFGMCSYA